MQTTTNTTSWKNVPPSKKSGLATYALVPGDAEEQYMWIQLTMNDEAMVQIFDPYGEFQTVERQHTPSKSQMACWTKQNENGTLANSHGALEFTWNTRSANMYIDNANNTSSVNTVELEDIEEATTNQMSSWKR